MKLVACKRCNAPNLHWYQNINGRWELRSQDGNPHHCDDGSIKAVKCKYCNASDLHWAEDVNPLTKAKKAVLTESYGLPHACDERLAAIAKEKQEKKDKYEAEKKRINEHTDGQCEACRGTGYAGYNAFTTCQCCFGQCTFNRKSREYMLRTVRHKIWPSMKDHYGSKYRW